MSDYDRNWYPGDDEIDDRLAARRDVERGWTSRYREASVDRFDSDRAEAYVVTYERMLRKTQEEEDAR